MKLIREINDLNKAIESNYKLGFVPTMGSLHKGHASLIKASKKKCNKTLVSIFVNPRQFNNNYDYKRYPRNINKDLKLLKKLKVDFVFLPTTNQIYKDRNAKKFTLNKTQKILCAKYRKGHFEGVLDIMNRFTNLILPKYVFMGEKDFQQLFLVKSYIEKNYKTKIYKCKTIRDSKKVALSSRNILLHKDKLKISSLIVNKMIKLKKKISRNRKLANKLIEGVKKELVKKFDLRIEYLEARNSVNLNKNIQNKNFKLFIAYYFDKVRLIDNF